MHRVWYAATEFLTDDRIAEALMEYASVLAVVDSADVVHIPGLDGSGVLRRIGLIVGPASQIVTMQTDDEHVDMNVAEAVDDLRTRARDRLPSSQRLAEFGATLAEQAEGRAPQDGE